MEPAFSDIFLEAEEALQAVQLYVHAIVQNKGSERLPAHTRPNMQQIPGWATPSASPDLIFHKSLGRVYARPGCIYLAQQDNPEAKYRFRRFCEKNFGLLTEKERDFLHKIRMSYFQPSVPQRTPSHNMDNETLSQMVPSSAQKDN